MRSSTPALLLACVALAACSSEAPAPDATTTATAAPVADDPVASAMSAAPAAVAQGATIVSMDGATMKTLREGTNGFTCMGDNPETPGPDPMCMDANALAWVEAWFAKKDPPAETPGVMYMLAGGTDASNIDPYATAPGEGNNWVETGPHMMVVGSASLLKGYPSGPAPDTKQPYVMWAGTPYAHLMIPVS